MKVCHWTIYNGSGMHRVAESCVEGERRIGIDSVIANPQDEMTWIHDVDIHVSHTHLPEKVNYRDPYPFNPKLERVTKGKPVVWVSHGTPEHVFETSVEARGYGAADGWMLLQNWLRTAHACVTFWPRHHWILQSMCQRGRKVDLIPLGIDKEFWKKVPSDGKFAGNPSVLTGENQHRIKWSLDLFLIWPAVREAMVEATLHQLYLPTDMHRWFFPLVNANGCSYASYISGSFAHTALRNAFCSVDYYIGLVRYGDFNRISLEANACGTRTISYRGNPYSDFWITEGDQRDMAQELLPILEGKVEPRQKEDPPSIEEMAKAMKEEVYDKL